MISVGEPLELYYSLYSAETNQFVTEEFLVKLTELGMPDDISLMNKLSTLFVDLDADDLRRNLYLVCRIFRRGKLIAAKPGDKSHRMSVMQGGGGGKDVEQVYRRPFGCAVLSISKILGRLNGEEEFSSPIYTPTAGKVEELSSTLHRLIIANGGGVGDSYELAPRANGVVVKLKLVGANTEGLEEVSRTPKLYFARLIKPTVKRNDFYITLLTGSYLRDRKRAQKNVLVKVYLLNKRGELVDALVRGTGPQNQCASSYESTVYYHTNSPEFKETIRLSIPSANFENLHLLFVYFHASSKAAKTHAFSFGFLKLVTPSGVVIPDKEHTLECYKITRDMEKSIGSIDPAWLSRVEKYSARPKEKFVVATRLCSTFKTQKEELHALFSWRDIDEEKLIEVCERITYLQDSEIVKFLREILSVLMGIFSERHSPTLLKAAYRLFVSILTILSGHYSNYIPVLDAYISEIFDSANIYMVLLDQLKLLFEWVRRDDLDRRGDDIERRALVKTMKCFSYVIRFIVHSRQKDVKNESASENEFRQEIFDVIFYVDEMMTRTSPAWLLAIQTHTLKSVAGIFEHLKKVFSVSDLGEIARGFLESIKDGNTSWSVAKLSLCLRLVKSDVVQRRESRHQVMAAIIRLIQRHLNESESERMICVAIIRELLDILRDFPRQKSTSDSDYVWNVSILLPDILKALKREVSPDNGQTIKVSKSIEAIVGDINVEQVLFTSLASIVFLMSEQQEAYYFKAVLEDDVQKRAFVQDALTTFRLFSTQKNIYPDSWILMRVFALTCATKVLNWFSKFISSMQNTTAYFNLGISVLRGSFMDKMDDSLSGFVQSRLTSARSTIFSLLNKSWDNLGEKKSKLSAIVVAPLIEFSISSNDPLRSFGQAMYFDLLRFEFASINTFATVEVLTIDAVDRIVQQNMKGKKSISSFFDSHLREKFQNDELLSAPRPLEFLSEISKLFDLLDSLSKYPRTSEFEDERVSATLQLMAYLQKTKRMDMYLKYAQELCDLHLSLGNYSEAGFAMLLEANLAKWPARENHLRKAIEYFVKSENYEEAIVHYKTLGAHFELQAYNYAKLGEVLREQAMLFEQIATAERFYPPYFRVAFVGEGHSASVANEEFVYRGNQLESIMDFSSRIRQKYPEADVLPPGKPVPADKRAEAKQYLQISTITPCSEDGAPNMIDAIPKRVGKYIKNNNVRRFFAVRPFRKRALKRAKTNFWTRGLTRHFMISRRCFRRRIAEAASCALQTFALIRLKAPLMRSRRRIKSSKRLWRKTQI